MKRWGTGTDALGKMIVVAMLYACAAMSAHAADGDYVWAKQLGGTSQEYADSVAVDSAGNVYTTGNFYGTADFDPGAGTANLNSVGTYDAFVSKLDGSGNFVWAKQWGGPVDAGARSMTLDSSGGVYTTGYFRGTADFDPGTGTVNLTSFGDRDVFVSKLDSSGNFVWAKQMGGTNWDEALSVAVDSAGNVYTTGNFYGTADFDPGAGTANLTDFGGSDVFVSKLSGPPDTAAPNAITITPATTGPTNADSIDFTVTFDEPLQNFDAAADVIVTHTGTSSSGVAITGGPTTYTVSVQNVAGDGSFTVAVMSRT